MAKKIGFIGGGNMGGAVIGGIIESGLVAPADIIASAATEATRALLATRWGIAVTADNREVARAADILIPAVKPHVYPSVVDEVQGVLKEGVVVVSIAAGHSVAALESFFSAPVKVVRAMPNTPALVGEGMTALCRNSLVSDAELESVLELFRAIGRVEIVDEALMDAVVGVSGSSPAYVYIFIEAMADAAVESGMPRAQAYRFAAQAVLGAAKMVLETGSHPGLLKDQVCSPGGTTIAAVRVLEENGLRRAVMSAALAAAERSRAMGRRAGE